MAILFRDFFPLIDQDYIRAKDDDLRMRFYAYGKKQSLFTGEGADKEVDMFLDEFIEMEKGCQMVWERNTKFPMSIYCLREHIVVLSQFKRGMPLFLRFIKGTGEFKKPGWHPIERILSTIGALVWWKYTFYWAWWGMRDIYLDEKKYNQPARELHQAIKNEKLRDLICAITEYDSAYKFRAMDIAAETKKEEFVYQPFLKRVAGYLIMRHSGPVKEIKRLLEIVVKRESIGNMQSDSDGIKGGLAKILIFKSLLLWYIELKPGLLKEICETVNRIDFEAIKPTINDKFWMCSPAYAYSYDFMGMDKDQRKVFRDNLEKNHEPVR
jgi:hypothetical protein